MASLATTLPVVLDRVVDDLVDLIAKEGLVALKQVLDDAGFGDSPYLKDYEVFSHVYGDTVAFEILLDFEAVVPSDAPTQAVLDAAAQQAAQAPDEPEEELLEEDPTTTYGMGSSGPRRVVSPRNAKRDARRPARDARRPARDARTTSRDRLVAKEVANITPRSAYVTRDGRLSVALQRSAKKVGDELVMPQGQFQGIIGDFMDKISTVIATAFSAAISDIISRHYA